MASRAECALGKVWLLASVLLGVSTSFCYRSFYTNCPGLFPQVWLRPICPSLRGVCVRDERDVLKAGREHEDMAYLIAHMWLGACFHASKGKWPKNKPGTMEGGAGAANNNPALLMMC